MNKVKMVLAFLLVGVFAGCGGEPPPPQTSNDAAVADATPVVDVSAPADSGADRDIVPTGDQPGTDGGVDVCVPYINSMDQRFTCEGAALCQPNSINPTCTGARACTCGEMTESQMAEVCRDDMSCATIVRNMTTSGQATCEPGHNRCSVNLPRDTEYVPFFLARDVMFEVFRLYEWYQLLPGNRTRSIGYLLGTMDSPYGPRGFVQIMKFSGPADCSGQRCYFRRSEPLRSVVDSIEVEFRSRCQISVRRFPPGADQPSETVEYGAIPCPEA